MRWGVGVVVVPPPTPAAVQQRGSCFDGQLSLPVAQHLLRCSAPAPAPAPASALTLLPMAINHVM